MSILTLLGEQTGGSRVSRASSPLPFPPCVPARPVPALPDAPWQPPPPAPRDAGDEMRADGPAPLHNGLCWGGGFGGCGNRDPPTDTARLRPARLLRFPLRSVGFSMGMLCRSLRMLCRSLALWAGSSEPWLRERMVGEEFCSSKASFPLILTASQILALLEQQLPGIPVPAPSPGTGWAGATGVNGVVVTQLRVLILHCGLCVQLLIAFVPWVASPAAQDPRRQRSRLFSLLSALLECWSPGTAPVWRDLRARHRSPPRRG